MNVIIHDLPGRDRLEELLGPMNDDDKIIERKDKDPVPCMGCFGCWIKTPGMCVIKDGFEDTGAYMGAAQELRIVSRCTYGEFSPFVKKCLTGQFRIAIHTSSRETERPTIRCDTLTH